MGAAYSFPDVGNAACEIAESRPAFGESKGDVVTTLEKLIDAAEDALTVIEMQDRELGNPYDPDLRLRAVLAEARRELMAGRLDAPRMNL